MRANCFDNLGLSFTVFVLLVVWIVETSAGNACCSYPCENGGICMTNGDDRYVCDCTGLEYYGTRCEKPNFWRKVKSYFSLEVDTKDYIFKHYWILSKIFSLVPSIRKAIMRTVIATRSEVIDSPATYSSNHAYKTADAYFNHSFYTRTLPPVPKECPTPMGVVGPKELPDLDMILQKFFLRKKFQQDPAGSNALFPFFAQFFTHQFFKTDYKKGAQYQWGQHGVDCSNIYGKNSAEARKLRSLQGGKLKSQMIDGEEYPPNVQDADVTMIYKDFIPKEHRLAVGQEFFGILPGLLLWSTIWLREHNNICDQLAKEHPDWSDEQLYQTAKLTVIAETLKIVVEEYVQHLSGYHFQLTYDPEVVHGTSMQFQNRISIEFVHLYHWHPLMPSEIFVENSTYKIKDLMFQPGILLKHGFRKMLEGLVSSPGGAFGPQNHDPTILSVVKTLLKNGRDLRLQPFNQYRKKFRLPAYKTFEELTGEKELAKELSEAYNGEIDAVEFFVGLCLEKKRPGYGVFGQSMTEIGAPYSIFGIFANPISSPQYWKPSTFGGENMFNRIKTMSMQRLFCENMEGECPYVSFKLQNYEEVRKKLAEPKSEL